MDNFVLRTQLSILTGSTITACEAGSVLGAALLLAAHRARESDDRTVLSAPPSPCSTPCVIGRYDRAVRALDGGGGSRSSSDKLPREKVEAAAAAKPSMRSPRVTRSSSSPSANGACCKPAVGAWARPHTLCIQAQLLVPRLRLHSFWQSSIHARPPGTRLQRNVGPPPRHVRPRAVRRSWCDDGNGGGDRCHEGATRGAVRGGWLAERSAHCRFVGCR